MTAMGKDREALADRNEAIRLKPDFAEGFLARGGSYHALGMHDQGLADRTEAIRLKPDLAEAWCARGSAFFLLGQYGKAIDDLNQALRLKPDYAEAQMVLGKAQSAQARLEIPKVETPHADVPAPAIPSPPPVSAKTLPPPVPVKKASREVRVEPIKTPVKAPVKAPVQAMDTASAMVHNQRGRDLLNQGKSREAIEELNEAIRQSPDFALAYNARWIWMMLPVAGLSTCSG